MSSSNSNSNKWVPNCSCREMICLISHTKTNPNRKFWRRANWKNENGYGMFIWKDEIGNEKNLALLIENVIKKTMDGLMDRQNEILWATIEEMKHASEERKKSNKLSCIVMFLCCLISMICVLKMVS